jgi:hypothetical protein
MTARHARNAQFHAFLLPEIQGFRDTVRFRIVEPLGGATAFVSSFEETA